MRESKQAPYAEIGSVCFMWYDGERSAMRAVSKGEAFSPRKLIGEVAVCLAKLCGEHTAIERAKLEKVREWAQNEAVLEAAETAINRVAKQACAAGLPAWQAKDVFEKALRQHAAKAR